MPVHILTGLLEGPYPCECVEEDDDVCIFVTCFWYAWLHLCLAHEWLTHVYQVDRIPLQQLDIHIALMLRHPLSVFSSTGSAEDVTCGLRTPNSSDRFLPHRCQISSPPLFLSHCLLWNMFCSWGLVSSTPGVLCPSPFDQ